MSKEFVCSVSRAGIRADGGAQLELAGVVKVNEEVLPKAWYVSSPAIAREVLALALTAITMGMNLDCVFTEPISPFSPIESAFLSP
jgi:hypothetical protein